jgi:energy-coupling factor transporter ATP-binding protein EcfA2
VETSFKKYRSWDLLLLDEPTNHLDFESISWLINYVKQYPHTVLFVTHDRYFLNEVSTRIIELNKSKWFVGSSNNNKSGCSINVLASTTRFCCPPDNSLMYLVAKTLIEQPDLLLLDEPTNHLDFESISWLINYVKHVLASTTRFCCPPDNSLMYLVVSCIPSFERIVLISAL